MMKLSQKIKRISPFADSLGVEIDSLESGICQASLPIKQSLLNIHDSVHGGVIYSLADIAMGAALFSIFAENEACSTIEIKINYLKPARGEKISATAKVLHRGKNIGVVEAEIENNGVVVAKAMGTFAIFFKERQVADK